MIWLIRRLTLIFCVCCIYSYIIVLWFGFLPYMSLVLPLFLSIDVICCGFSACFLVCLFYCIVVWFGTYVIVQTRVSVLPLNSKYRQADWNNEAQPILLNQLICIQKLEDGSVVLSCSHALFCHVCYTAWSKYRKVDGLEKYGIFRNMEI